LKVCFIGSSFSSQSGVTRPAISLARMLSRKGIDVSIVTGSRDANYFDEDGTQADNLPIEGVPTRCIPNLTRILFFSKSRRRSLIRSIFEGNDIVHGFDFLSLYALKRAMVAEGCRHVPLIYTSTGSFRLSINDLVDSGPESFMNL